MDNVFTPEEANMPVTYGELAVVLETLVKEIAKNTTQYSDDAEDYTLKAISKLMDSIIEMRDNIEYKRIRDVHFMIGLLAQVNYLNKDVLLKEYPHWCEEFDKLNKPKPNKEDANE
jgi:hypothetical protein